MGNMAWVVGGIAALLALSGKAPPDVLGGLLGGSARGGGFAPPSDAPGAGGAEGDAPGAGGAEGGAPGAGGAEGDPTADEDIGVAPSAAVAAAAYGSRTAAAKEVVAVAPPRTPVGAVEPIIVSLGVADDGQYTMTAAPGSPILLGGSAVRVANRIFEGGTKQEVVTWGDADPLGYHTTPDVLSSYLALFE